MTDSWMSEAVCIFGSQMSRSTALGRGWRYAPGGADEMGRPLWSGHTKACGFRIPFFRYQPPGLRLDAGMRLFAGYALAEPFSICICTFVGI